MTILTEESRALLKRMDADDAIDKAIELALEAAAQVCERRLHREFERPIYAVSSCRDAIRALKEQK